VRLKHVLCNVDSNWCHIYPLAVGL
jgi:hypothetical protein